jgi:SAM-dependent methyltransferase
MNIHEYETMHRVERDHWWYHGLRGVFRHWMSRCGTRRVLDAGCGTGINLALLQHQGYEAAGIDASPEALRFCEQRGVRDVRQAVIQSLPFDDGQFEVIYSFDVLGILEPGDREKALREFFRCLSAGGMLMLNVAALQWLYSAHDVATHIKTRFSRRQLCGMLREAGFEIVFASYRVFLLFPLIALFKVFDRRDPRAAHDSKTEGHLDKNSALINPILIGVMGLENWLMRIVPLPVGSSLFVVARKPARAS